MTNAPLIGAERCLDAGLALALSETQNEKLRGPREKGWNQNPLSREVIQQRLSNGSTGYAIITGDLSGDVVAVDPDSLEASMIVDLFFPEGPSWGRTVDGETLTRAVLVRCPGASNYEYPKQFELIANSKAIDGPGSVHYETNESRFQIRKFDEHPIPDFTPVELDRRVRHMELALYLSTDWFMYPRNSTTMALSACLYRAGVSLDEAERIVRAILILSEDDEPDNRMDVLTRTYTAGNEDKAITAEADLLKLFGKAKFQRVDQLVGLHGAVNILGVRVRPKHTKRVTPLPKSPGKAETPKARPKAKSESKLKPEPDPEPKAVGGKEKIEPLPSDDPFKKECIPLDIYVQVRRAYPTQGLTPKTLKAAEAVAKICKSDLSFAANSVCSVAEFVGSMYYDIELPWTGAIVPATTYRMSFLESGEGKTEVERITSAGVRNAEKALDATFEMRSKEYQAKKQAYEELNRALVKENKSKEGKDNASKKENTANPNEQRDALAAKLVDLEAPIPPQLPRLTSSDTTVEGLHRAMKKGYRVRALISGDAGTLLGGCSMRENLIYTLSKFSDVWSTGEFDRDRSSSDEDPERLYNVRLNIHWMVQPEIAREFIGSKIANEQGFLPRVLPVYPEPRFGKRGGLERYKATDDVDIKAWHTDTEKLAHPDNWSYALDDEGHQYPIRTTLRVTDAALAELDSFFREMERRASDDMDLGQIKSFAARVCENVLRAAVGFIVIEKGTNETEIDVDMVRAAIAQVRWHIDEWVMIKGEGQKVSEGFEDAQKVLDWLKAKGKKQFAARELSQKGPYVIQQKGKESRDAILETLQRHRFIKLIGESVVDGKRCLTVYDVRPGIFKS